MPGRIYFYVTVIWLLVIGVSVQAGDISGKVTARVKDLDSVVVYAEKIPGKVFDVPKEHAIMNQHNLQFIPHVLPVLVGTTVEFRNGDDVLHNVFTPSSAGKKFNLGSWAKGVVRTFAFQTPGDVVLLCNVHPEMEGYILVLETPFFAPCNTTGEYAIADIEAGSYSLKVWHPRLKGASSAVNVPATGAVKMDFEIRK